MTAKPNTESDKSIDEILGTLANTVYQHGKATKTNTPFHYGEPVKETSAKIHSLLMDVIGFDDDVNSFINQESDEDLLITLQENARNKLRAEQRTKLKELFNVKEK